MIKRLFFTLLLATAFVSTAIAAEKNPIAVIETSMGNIKIELFAKDAPITVKNFIDYAKSGYYEGTVFHRIVPPSPGSKIVVIQGGGLTAALQPKPGDRPPIKNEAANGLKNDRGTLSMARSGDPDSATSQFFINVKNNDFLNRPSPDNFGYAVFAKVVEGMDVVDKIVAAPIKDANRVFKGVPVTPIVIKSVKILK